MTTSTADTDPTIKRFERIKDRYRARNDAVRRWYQMYFVEDRYAEPGVDTLATPDSRNAADLGIYILSRNPHIDRVPFNVHPGDERVRMNMAERFLSAMWRTVDLQNLMRGTPWHQRRLAGSEVMTGWFAQFTALVPGRDGFPKAVADIWDPTTVYPEWGGPDGHLRSVDHEFYYYLDSLREMADANGWSVPASLDGDGDSIVTVVDHWEAKYNRKDPSKPDILNSVYVSAESQNATAFIAPLPMSKMGWVQMQPPTNRRTDTKQGGFHEIPILVGPIGGVEMASSYTQNTGALLAKLGQGLLAPLEGVQDSINRQISTVLQELSAARIAQATPVITSESGDETLEPDDMGKTDSRMTNTSISYPHAFVPQTGTAQVVIGILNDLFQRASFSWTSLGQTSFTLSGVAIERLNESARSHLEPYHFMMRHVYQLTCEIWLRDYKFRFGNNRKFGRVRLQGMLGREGLDSGFFDEEFTPDQIPESRYIHTEIPWGLVEDDMMKANIARALTDILSPTWIRENILKVPDVQLEARRVAQDKVESAPFWVNVQLADQMKDAIKEAATKGDMDRAQLLGVALTSLLQSLQPAQGRGIPERPGQGPPEAGGNLTNARGARPELSPANQTPALAIPEASGMPGAQGQAERNI